MLIMQQWSDNGIIISASRFGEQSGIVRVLTEQHGLFAGMVKGAFSPKKQGIFQAGNFVHVQWQARLEEQLGHMQCELLYSNTPLLLASSFALRMVNAMTSLILAILPERIEERAVYHASKFILSNIIDEDKSHRYYAEFEMTLLQALGFGLDLEECAATGNKNQANLAYVSPKTGRAVCLEAGEAYKNRLFPLPKFLLDKNATVTQKDIIHCLNISGYFIEQWLLLPEGKKIPLARQEWVRCLQKENV